MKKLLYLFLFSLVFSVEVFSANYYYVGTLVTLGRRWNNTNAWSTTSGGAGGAGIPGNGDIAIFDNGVNRQCLIDVNVDVAGISITNYANTITQGDYTVTVGSSGFSQASGTFTSSGYDITVNGAFSVSGGTFTSTSGTLTVLGNYTFSGGTFNHNSGTVKFKSGNGFTSSTYTGNPTLYNLTIETVTSYSKTGTIASGNTITVNNNLLLTGPTGVRLLTGSIDAKGNITTSHGSNSAAGSATININGTSNQNLTGSSKTDGALPKIVINKASGTLKLVGHLSVDNNWTYTAGTIDADTSTIAFGVAGTISGSHTLKNVIFQGKSAVSPAFTISSGTILTVPGNLSFENAGKPINMVDGEIRVAGNLDISTNSSSSQVVGTTIVRLNGSDKQLMSGNSAQSAWLPIIYIDNTDTVELSGGFCIPSQWRYLQGVIIPGTSTVGFAKNATICGNPHSLYNVNFYSTNTAASTFTIEDTTLLTVKGDLSLKHFNGTNSISFSEGTIHIEGDIIVDNSAHPASHTATFHMKGTSNQTIFGFGALKGSLPNMVINKTSGILFLDDVISILGNWTHTAGIIDATTGSSTLYFDTKVATTVTGSHSINNLTLYRTGGSTSSFTIASGTTLTVDGNFTTENTGLTTIETGDMVVKGNITLSDMLDGGTGNIIIAGTSNQRIQGTTSNTTGELPKLTINKSSGTTTIAKLVNVKTNLNLLKGNFTTYNNDSLIVLLDNATSTNGSDTSFVSGPIKKIGNDAFTFPTGKGTLYRPTSISAPSSTSDAYTAEYFNTEQTNGSSKASTLMQLSTCEHWKIDRNNGSSNVNLSLSWNDGSCNIPYYLTDLRLALWNGSQWTDKSYTSSTGTRGTGTFTANTVNAYGYFTIAEVQTNPREIVVHNVTPVTLYRPEIGDIDIEVVGGYLPLSFSWSNGETTEDIDSLTFNSYTITVTDNNSNVIYKTIDLNIAPTFSDLSNATFENNYLSSTHTTNEWGFSGATSDDYIEKGHAGFVSAIIVDASKTLSFGLSDLEYGLHYNHTRYGILVENERLFVYMDSSGVGLTVGRDGNNDSLIVQDNDTIMIERVLMAGDSVSYRFYHNGYKFYTRNNIDFSRSLLVDIAFKSPEASLRGMIGKFEVGKLTYRPCTSDDHKNHQTVVFYDENGGIVAKTRIYYDLLGRPLQTQALDFENQTTMATQLIYDEFGRATIQTLPAPLDRYNVDCYASYFVRTDNGTVYNYSDFDKPNTNANLAGEVYNPNGINNVLAGTLGHYYSNNNTEEAYVAASAYPYYRTEYHSDPIARIRSQSSPGEKLKTGTGNEGGAFYVNYGNELVYIDPNLNDKHYFKTVVIDSEGKEAISWTDNWGNLIATARSGLNGTSICSDQWATSILDYQGTRSVTIHIPDAGKDDVYLHVTPNAVLNGSICNGSNITMGISNWGIKLIDIRRNKQLISGTDYTINHVSAFKYKINFINNYEEGSDFIRISMNYTDDFICAFYSKFSFPAELPDMFITYLLDYSHFSLNKYDSKGLLTEVYSPAAIDCQSYSPEFSPQAFVQTDFLPIYNYSGSTYNTASNLDPEYTAFISNSVYSANPTKYDRKLSIRLSNFGVIISVDPDDLELSCDPTDPDVDFLYNNLSEYSQNHGSGVLQNMLAKDNVYNTVSKIATLVNEAAIEDELQRRLINGHRQQVPDGEEEPCETIAHCFDGITNCAETSTDVGGGCPSLPCVDSPPVLLATYQYTFTLIGLHSSVETILDENGNADAGHTFVFYAYLYRTCNCEYFFDGSSMQEFTCNIPEVNLVNYQELYFHLEGIDVKVEPSPAYAALNASNKIHDFAKYIGYNATYTLVIYPEVAAPNHNTDDGYADKYFYNEKFEMDRAELGDEGIKQTVYDSYGRVRFTRNSEQENNNQFSYVKYDRAGRVIETGTYTSNSGIGNVYEFLEDASAAPTSGYTSVHNIVDDNSLPSIGGFEVSFASYDVADDSPGWSVSHSTYVQENLLGRISSSSNENSTTWYSYNMYGEIVWTIQYVNALDKYFSHQYTYNYLGNLTKTAYQDEETDERFYHYYEYDNNNRLIAVKTNTTDNAGTANLDATYHYYLHGPVKRLELGTELQGIDYIYTINGWLKGINAPELSDRDPGKDGYSGTHSAFAKDVFGMTIDYFTGDYLRKNTHVQTFDMGTIDGFEEGQHNGNIKAIRWQTKESSLEFADEQLMYYYQYDNFNQLSDANFYTVTANGTGNGAIQQYGQSYYGPSVDAESAYSEKGITYDFNGNITSLQRKNENGTLIDNLTYHYISGSNKLDYVDDAVSDGTVNYDIDDQASANYVYNENGQLVTDIKKDMDVLYFQNGLVKEVKENGGNTLYKLTYDEEGKRLSKEVYVSGSLDHTLWYIRDASGSLTAVYNDDGIDLEQEELSISGSSQVGVYYRDVSGYRKYQITDHLGNVRAVIKDEKDMSGDAQLAETTDYFPFGAELPGRNFISAGGFRFSYQGQEVMDVNGQTLVNFELRNYDPNLGRWLSPDPYRQFYSPYEAMANNPVLFADPSGGWSMPAWMHENIFSDGYNWVDEYEREIKDYITTRWNPTHQYLMQTFGGFDGLIGIVGSILNDAGYSSENGVWVKRSSSLHGDVVKIDQLGNYHHFIYNEDHELVSGKRLFNYSTYFGSFGETIEHYLSGFNNNSYSMWTDEYTNQTTISAYFNLFTGDVQSYINKMDMLYDRSFSLKVSFGAQVGLDFQSGKTGVGGYVNVTSVELFSYTKNNKGEENIDWILKDKSTLVLTHGFNIGFRGILGGGLKYSHRVNALTFENVGEEAFEWWYSIFMFGDHYNSNGENSTVVSTSLSGRFGVGVEVDFTSSKKKFYP